MNEKNFAIILSLLYSYSYFIILILKLLWNYDKRVLSKRKKYIQTLIILVISIGGLFYLCIKDNLYFLKLLKESYNTYSSHLNYYGYLFVFTCLSIITTKFIFYIIGITKESKLMFVLNNHYKMLDIIENRRKKYESEEMNKSCNELILLLDKMTEERTAYIELTSCRYLLKQLYFKKLNVIVNKIKQSELRYESYYKKFKEILDTQDYLT